VKDLFIALDSLKFYKLKSEKTVRILFLILYALFFSFYMFPIGDILDPEEILTTVQNSGQVLSLLKIGHLYNILSVIGLSIITSFIALIYSTCFVMETEGFPGKKAVIASLRNIPKLILFVLILIAPVAISAIFIFIPLIFIYYSLIFAPLFIVEGKKTVIESIIESFRHTRGFRFSIFITQAMVYFLMNIPISIVISASVYSGNENSTAQYLILAFLKAAYVLMGGRLIGNFYVMIVKNSEKLNRVKLDIFNLNRNVEDDEAKNKTEDDDGDETDEESEDGTDNREDKEEK
jgi:hypothetical protein